MAIVIFALEVLNTVLVLPETDASFISFLIMFKMLDTQHKKSESVWNVCYM
jgi:hypothetical protein